MDKDKILQMSRAENEGMPDEWEQSVDAKAAGVSRVVGLVMCLLLVFVAAPLLDNPQLGQGAWLVFFAMEGSSDLYQYLKTRKRSKLLWAVLKLFCVAGYLGILWLWTKV